MIFRAYLTWLWCGLKLIVPLSHEGIQRIFAMAYSMPLWLKSRLIFCRDLESFQPVAGSRTNCKCLICFLWRVLAKTATLVILINTKIAGQWLPIWKMLHLALTHPQPLHRIKKEHHHSHSAEFQAAKEAFTNILSSHVFQVQPFHRADDFGLRHKPAARLGPLE